MAIFFLFFFLPGFSPTRKEFDLTEKTGQDDSKELLQIFDIRGSAVSKIHASEDFKKFVTIDNAGIVYILEEISNMEKRSPNFLSSTYSPTNFYTQ